MERRMLLLDRGIVVRSSLAELPGLADRSAHASARPTGVRPGREAAAEPRGRHGASSVMANDSDRAESPGGVPAPGTAAVDLVIPAHRSRVERALRTAWDEGEVYFLFREVLSGCLWLGHLASLSEGEIGKVDGAELLLWTWEPAPPVCHSLSPRQREILLALLEGSSATNVAQRLGISANTVRTHLTRCQCAVRCEGHATLIAWAHRHRRVLELLAREQAEGDPVGTDREAVLRGN